MSQQVQCSGPSSCPVAHTCVCKVQRREGPPAPVTKVLWQDGLTSQAVDSSLEFFPNLKILEFSVYNTI